MFLIKTFSRTVRILFYHALFILVRVKANFRIHVERFDK